MSKPPSSHRRGHDEPGNNVSIGQTAGRDIDLDGSPRRRQSRSAVRTIEAVWAVKAKRGARGLSPAYFALVMATGIVSIASDRAGFHTIAVVLLWLNAGQFLVLWILTLWRLLRYRRELIADLTDHRSGPGFLSAVAATGVLGNQV